MRLYTIHLRSRDPESGPDMVLVKEGFCWPAFFFTFVWALWHRLWLLAVLLLAGHLVLDAAVYAFGADPVSATALDIGYQVVVGILANDLRRRALERRGFAEAAVVSGPNRERALAAYLDGIASRAAEAAP